jgi:hypothetical protein
VEDHLRRFITFESPDAGLLQRAFGALYEVFQDGGPAEEEPMLNVLGFYTNAEIKRRLASKLAALVS